MLSDEGEDLYHFIAYTPIGGVLYELDGLQPAPISHGICTFEDFPPKVTSVLRKRIERYPTGEIRFNLMAMVRDLRLQAREIGDQERLLREEQKRRAWLWENALRRHNFIGFTGELMREIVNVKLNGGDEGYERWIDDARIKTKARMKERTINQKVSNHESH